MVSRLQRVSFATQFIDIHPESEYTGGERIQPFISQSRKTIVCAFVLWESRCRSMLITGATLCYTSTSVCRLVIVTMVLHNICIANGLQWESEFNDDGEEEDVETVPHDYTTSTVVDNL